MKEFLSNFYKGLNNTQKIILVILIFVVTGIIFIMLYNYFYKTDEALDTLMNLSENEVNGEEVGIENSNNNKDTKSLADRIGFSKEQDPSKIEQDLLKTFPKKYLYDVNQKLIGCNYYFHTLYDIKYKIIKI